MLCLVPAAIGITIAAQGQPSRSPEQRVAKSGTRSSTENANTANKEVNGSPNVTLILKQENPATHKSDENKVDENIAIQRKLANFTFSLVVVGLIQAGILAGTVYVIWRQKSTCHIERAWVMVDLEHDSQKWSDRKVHVLSGSGTEGDSTRFFAVLICRNEGRSPAWLGERRAKFEIVDYLPPEPNLEATEIIEVSPTPLGIGQALPHTERLSFPMTAQGHEEPGKMNVIYGVVKYRDIFQKQRQTTFGYRLTHDRKFVRLEGDQYRKYNENT